jgi:hypothetical protein
VRVQLGGDLGNGNGGKELYVRVHHAFEPELSKRITAGIDPDYAFIFPLDDVGDMAGAGKGHAAGSPIIT